MELLELMKERYSVRKFKEREIEKEKLEKILEAGRVAPTACNNQPQRILVLREKESMEKMKKCTPFTFDAPVILLICADKDKGWIRKYDGENHAKIDVSIVTTQMMLEAYNNGIGSTWVCHFDPKKIKEEFNIPHNFEPINILPIGYPNKDSMPNPMHQKRLDLSEIVFYEKY